MENNAYLQRVILPIRDEEATIKVIGEKTYILFNNEGILGWKEIKNFKETK